jgi:succinate dehydrogenase/fumarate reductase flavoprotein subunit
MPRRSKRETRVYAPLDREHGLPPAQVEYKLRRFVNDYLQPPKVTKKMQIGLQRFSDIERDLEQMKANNAHELMRAMEVSVIRDCAEMAARASLFRAESRWGCTTTGSITRNATTASGSAIAT